jgi:hypothetical protein
MSERRDPVEIPKNAMPAAEKRNVCSGDQTEHQGELLALFRLLVRQPLTDHDFQTCPICRRYGIGQI